MAISTKDELFVSLIESAVMHFEEAHEHNEVDNFDETFSSVAVGLEHITIAEAMKRNIGDTEAADLLLKKQEEYIAFSEKVQNRRLSLRSSASSTVSPLNNIPESSAVNSVNNKKEEEMELINNQTQLSPQSPGAQKLREVLGSINELFTASAVSTHNVEKSTTDSNHDTPTVSDKDEELGNLLVVKALDFDEKGDKQSSLSLYIKAVEHYLSFLDRKPDTPSMVKIVGELLDRIEYLRNATKGTKCQQNLISDAHFQAKSVGSEDVPLDTSPALSQNTTVQPNPIVSPPRRRFSNNADILALVGQYSPGVTSNIAVVPSPQSSSLLSSQEQFLEQVKQEESDDLRYQNEEAEQQNNSKVIESSAASPLSSITSGQTDSSPLNHSLLSKDDTAMLKKEQEMKQVKQASGNSSSSSGGCSNDSAWLSSIWGALKLNIKVPHQGTGNTPAPYAKPFTGILPPLTHFDSELTKPPALGSYKLRLFQDLEKLAQDKLKLESASKSKVKRKKERPFESNWARCKACGAFVAREINAIEAHITECLEGGAVAPYEGIRVITWNMERGYRLGSIIEELRNENPDIVLLQEVDVGCHRSFGNDTGAEIALALGMHIAFASEKDHVNVEKVASLSSSSKLVNVKENISEDMENNGTDDNEVDTSKVSDNNALLSDVVNSEPFKGDTDNEENIKHIKESSGGSNVDEKTPQKEAIVGESNVNEGSSAESSQLDKGNMISDHQQDSSSRHQCSGVEGIAILSRYPIVSVKSIHLPTAHKDEHHDQSKASTTTLESCAPSSHEDSSSSLLSGASGGGGHLAKSRTALRVETDTPVGLVVAYCCHLDAFAGRTARVHQLQPVLEDAKITTWEAVHLYKKPKPHIILGGDFNTHNHGIARLSRKMSGNEGLSGIGKTEAQWWDDVVFANSGLRDPFNKSDDSHNTWITVAGLTVWGGKIDWLLYAEDTMVCDAHHISQGGKSSDHPYLRVDLRKTPEV